jgi:hypothetical protein
VAEYACGEKFEAWWKLPAYQPEVRTLFNDEIDLLPMARVYTGIGPQVCFLAILFFRHILISRRIRLIW